MRNSEINLGLAGARPSHGRAELHDAHEELSRVECRESRVGGARPPRAQFSAPSRKTFGNRSEPREKRNTDPKKVTTWKR
jgi:hypothetical protein